MKYTLLDMTQTIMAAMESDEINSINDTSEALAVAYIIRTAYYDIVTRANIPSQYTVFSLEGSTDPTKPVLMTLPSVQKNVEWVKYDTSTVDDTDLRMTLVSPVSLDEFLSRMYMLKESDDNVGSFVQTIGTSAITFLYRNDEAPQFYTTYDDNTLIFNSYDAAVDSTLQKSKSLAYGQKVIPWEMADAFTPDLDESQFALLLNESKALAFAEMKQATHAKAEQNAKRGWVSIQRQKTKIPTKTALDAAPNFGRRR